MPVFACRYHEMLDVMDELGLEPNATLHHFTHPMWFEVRTRYGMRRYGIR